MTVTLRTPFLRLAAPAGLMLLLGACQPQQQPFVLYDEVAAVAPAPIAEPAADVERVDVTVAPWNPAAFGENATGWLPYVGLTAQDYAPQLAQWLAAANAFSVQGSETLRLHGELTKWEDLSPSAFGPSVFQITYEYALIDADGETLMEKTIVSKGEDTSFAGLTRMQLAMQHAHADSARQLVAALDSDFRQAWAAREKAIAVAEAERARIAASMEPLTGFYRGQADGAAIRDFPTTEGDRLGSIGLGAVYRASGRLPDGWIRIAPEDGAAGVEGWVHEAALTRMSEAEIAERLAAEEARRAAAADRYQLSPGDEPATLLADTAALTAPRSGAPTARTLVAGTAVEVVALTENGFALLTENARYVGWVDQAALQR
ncbi:MAG: SH3 domain-containing protein [Marivibrio sp.]|uniref:SH3 domain-containing protein n=1 Tax=Marivibrio sp. TaxID=2039719 RepID=UPI0032ECF6DD